mmetsp:Transcript_32202/g.42652  ORF Transcript_32202/g.42652 Transcript_32202/m.42652 type:complete len:198 (+) Transcript_32202:178-771(+)
MGVVRPWNILMYVRKSNDVDEILDALRDCLIYLNDKMLEKSSEIRRIQYVYLERWALDALEQHMATSSKLKEVPSSDERRTLCLGNSFIVLKEWNPEDDSSSSSRLSITATDNGMRPRAAAEQSKEMIDFEYVFSIGGDGTLLRLLRVLFFRFLPSSLPKIITVSMGSLGHLCNFKINDMINVLNATVLASEAQVQS